MYATGEIEDFSIVSEMIGSTHTHHREEEASNIYLELLPIYILLSRLLTEEYESISDFQWKHMK